MQWIWTEEADVNDLMEKLIVFAEHQGYKTQIIGRKRDILQVSKTDTFRLLTGLTSGLRLIITAKQGKTLVDVSGNEKEFGLKFVIMAIGLIGGCACYLPFLLVATAAYGLFAQNRLMDNIKKEIDDYFDSL